MKNFENLTLSNNELAAIKGGGEIRRAELDHVGAYNFTVEIEGINAGYFNQADDQGSSSESSSETAKG